MVLCGSDIVVHGARCIAYGPTVCPLKSRLTFVLAYSLNFCSGYPMTSWVALRHLRTDTKIGSMRGVFFIVKVNMRGLIDSKLGDK